MRKRWSDRALTIALGVAYVAVMVVYGIPSATLRGLRWQWRYASRQLPYLDFMPNCTHPGRKPGTACPICGECCG